MNERSTTLIPGASIYKPHIETGVEPVSIVEEAIRANEEAERQCSKRTRND